MTTTIEIEKTVALDKEALFDLLSKHQVKTVLYEFSYYNPDRDYIHWGDEPVEEFMSFYSTSGERMEFDGIEAEIIDAVSKLADDPIYDAVKDMYAPDWNVGRCFFDVSGRTIEAEVEEYTLSKEQLLVVLTEMDYTQVLKKNGEYFTIHYCDLDYQVKCGDEWYASDFFSNGFEPGQKVYWKQFDERAEYVGTAVDPNKLTREQLLEVLSDNE